METSRPEKSLAGSSRRGARSEAKDNLEQCLEALDREGEAGLRREVARIHPLQGESDPTSMGRLQADRQGKVRWVPRTPGRADSLATKPTGKPHGNPRSTATS